MSQGTFIAELQAREAIEQLLIAFAQAQDHKTFDAMESLVTADVEADFRDNGVVVGKDNLISLQRQFLGGVGPTQHLLGNFRIKIAGSTATSICCVRAIHAAQVDGREITVDLWGEYHDSLLLTDQGWRIRRRVHLFHNSSDYKQISEPS
jgi:hypothetical protein